MRELAVVGAALHGALRARVLPAVRGGGAALRRHHAFCLLARAVAGLRGRRAGGGRARAPPHGDGHLHGREVVGVRTADIQSEDTAAAPL